MFKFLNKLNYISNNEKEISIEIKSLTKKINIIDDFIIVKNDKIKIYNRICDHMGGRIISNNNEHKCPIHNWKFYPIEGIYANGIKKKEQEYSISNGNILIKKKSEIPNITQAKATSDVKIRFFNHAFLSVETKDFKFATDPWAIGPAFNTGWWLKKKTKSDWLDELNSCSFIYVSHNHPDHLHPITLSKIDKNIPIIVPNFVSDSTGNYMETLGFKNVIRLEFTKVYKFKKTNLTLCFLKSGDFREDSGIYFSIGNFKFLFDVDSAMINFNKLPKVDFYASSFAGGASGYPLMFENYSKKEKNLIMNKDIFFSRSKKIQMIKKINPSYFLPYAGFFEEKLNRDKEIKKENKKNSIEDYIMNLNNSKTRILNVNNYDEFYFKKKMLTKQKNNSSNYYKDLSPDQYLAYYKKNFSKIDINYIKKYFIRSNYFDNLILYISLTDDNFFSSKIHFKINFSLKNIKFEILKHVIINKINKEKSNRVLYLKCRKESFLNTIYNKAPWEDLSIGFQVKVLRFPNEYNAKFWHHFTNEYTTKKNIRFSSECAKCETITSFIDNLIFKDKHS